MINSGIKGGIAGYSQIFEKGLHQGRIIDYVFTSTYVRQSKTHIITCQRIIKSGIVVFKTMLYLTVSYVVRSFTGCMKSVLNCSRKLENTRDSLGEFIANGFQSNLVQ